MLLISKSIAQLILPPGGLIMLGILGLIFWRKAWAKYLIALVFALFWLLSTEPVRDMLTSPLEMQYPAFDSNHMDISANQHTAIVLLGGGIRENSLDYQGSDELSPYAMMRTIYAAKIAQSLPFPIYSTGGTPLRQNSEAEADIMKRWLMWFNITESRIHAENNANTTWENAVLTKKMLSQQGINTIILVTSAWHMPRSVWCFQAQGLTVIPAPTDYFTQQKSYDLRSFLPKWSVFAESGHILHEYLGLLWYTLKYDVQTAIK